jgi:hypothetical protein
MVQVDALLVLSIQVLHRRLHVVLLKVILPPIHDDITLVWCLYVDGIVYTRPSHFQTIDFEHFCYHG